MRWGYGGGGEGYWVTGETGKDRSKESPSEVRRGENLKGKISHGTEGRLGELRRVQDRKPTRKKRLREIDQRAGSLRGEKEKTIRVITRERRGDKIRVIALKRLGR